MGNVAPPLSGIGSRRSAGELRLRIVDPTRVNKDAVMPAYYRVHGLDTVAGRIPRQADPHRAAGGGRRRVSANAAVNT